MMMDDSGNGGGTNGEDSNNKKSYLLNDMAYATKTATNVGDSSLDSHIDAIDFSLSASSRRLVISEWTINSSTASAKFPTPTIDFENAISNGDDDEDILVISESRTGGSKSPAASVVPPTTPIKDYAREQQQQYTPDKPREYIQPHESPRKAADDRDCKIEIVNIEPYEESGSPSSSSSCSEISLVEVSFTASGSQKCVDEHSDSIKDEGFSERNEEAIRSLSSSSSSEMSLIEVSFTAAASEGEKEEGEQAKVFLTPTSPVAKPSSSSQSILFDAAQILEETDGEKVSVMTKQELDETTDKKPEKIVRMVTPDTPATPKVPQRPRRTTLSAKGSRIRRASTNLPAPVVDFPSTPPGKNVHSQSTPKYAPKTRASTSRSRNSQSVDKASAAENDDDDETHEDADKSVENLVENFADEEKPSSPLPSSHSVDDDEFLDDSSDDDENFDDEDKPSSPISSSQSVDNEEFLDDSSDEDENILYQLVKDFENDSDDDSIVEDVSMEEVDSGDEEASADESDDDILYQLVENDEDQVESLDDLSSDDDDDVLYQLVEDAELPLDDDDTEMVDDADQTDDQEQICADEGEEVHDVTAVDSYLDESNESPKRGRGRPRKRTIGVLDSSILSEENNAVPAKKLRVRGRPRKTNDSPKLEHFDAQAEDEHEDLAQQKAEEMEVVAPMKLDEQQIDLHEEGEAVEKEKDKVDNEMEQNDDINDEVKTGDDDQLKQQQNEKKHEGGVGVVEQLVDAQQAEDAVDSLGNETEQVLVQEEHGSLDAKSDFAETAIQQLSQQLQDGERSDEVVELDANDDFQQQDEIIVLDEERSSPVGTHTLNTPDPEHAHNAQQIESSISQSFEQPLRQNNLPDLCVGHSAEEQFDHQKALVNHAFSPAVFDDDKQSVAQMATDLSQENSLPEANKMSIEQQPQNNHDEWMLVETEKASIVNDDEDKQREMLTSEEVASASADSTISVPISKLLEKTPSIEPPSLPQIHKIIQSTASAASNSSSRTTTSSVSFEHQHGDQKQHLTVTVTVAVNDACAPSTSSSSSELRPIATTIFEATQPSPLQIPPTHASAVHDTIDAFEKTPTEATIFGHDEATSFFDVTKSGGDETTTLIEEVAEEEQLKHEDSEEQDEEEGEEEQRDDDELFTRNAMSDSTDEADDEDEKPLQKNNRRGPSHRMIGKPPTKKRGSMVGQKKVPRGKFAPMKKPRFVSPAKAKRISPAQKKSPSTTDGGVKIAEPIIIKTESVDVAEEQPPLLPIKIEEAAAGTSADSSLVAEADGACSDNLSPISSKSSTKKTISKENKAALKTGRVVLRLKVKSPTKILLRAETVMDGGSGNESADPYAFDPDSLSPQQHQQQRPSKGGKSAKNLLKTTKVEGGGSTSFAIHTAAAAEQYHITSSGRVRPPPGAYKC